MVEHQEVTKEAFEVFAKSEFKKVNGSFYDGHDSLPILKSDKKYGQITHFSNSGRTVFDYGCTNDGILIERYRMYSEIDGKEVPYIKDVSFIKDGKNHTYILNYDRDGKQLKNAELKITSKVEWVNYNPITEVLYSSESNYPNYIYLQTNNEKEIKKHYKEQQNVINGITYDPPGIILRIEKNAYTALVSIPSEEKSTRIMERGKYFESEKTGDFAYVFDINGDGHIIVNRLNRKTGQQTELISPNVDPKHLELKMKSSMNDCAHILQEYPILLRHINY
jgi:hypothetical protein